MRSVARDFSIGNTPLPLWTKCQLINPGWLYILKNGDLIAQGSPEELRRQVGHGQESLEDIFLELTGGNEEAELIKGLEEG